MNPIVLLIITSAAELASSLHATGVHAYAFSVGIISLFFSTVLLFMQNKDPAKLVSVLFQAPKLGAVTTELFITLFLFGESGMHAPFPHASLTLT